MFYLDTRRDFVSGQFLKCYALWYPPQFTMRLRKEYTVDVVDETGLTSCPGGAE